MFLLFERPSRYCPARRRLTRSLRSACFAFSGGRISEDAAQPFCESVERAHWIISGHVYDLVGFAGGFFQHVCGNSEPMSAL